MSEYIEIIGGKPLHGAVRVGGAKNAALPLMIASLLTPERCVFKNVPNLEDVHLTVNLLEQFGSEISRIGDSISATTPKLLASAAHYSLVKALRASFWVLGPLLARGGAARVALPGGDIIGARPVDLHISALEQMGAEIRVKHGVVLASAIHGLKPAEISLRFPSVGATHQVLMAAARTKGRTVLHGAAREPEVVALAEMLNQMGAEVEGAGTATISIVGVEELRGCEVYLIGDRIEAGTYLLAGTATRGAVEVQGVAPSHLGALCEVLSSMGADVATTSDSVQVEAKGQLRPVATETAPFPGFPTDLQAPLVAALGLIEGESSVAETVYEGRFGHVAELGRLGARITVSDRRAIITGVDHYAAARVDALDIRAGAALVIAGLAASGVTEIHEVHHLRRGYERLEQKLLGLGAQVARRLVDPEDYLVSGC